MKEKNKGDLWIAYLIIKSKFLIGEGRGRGSVCWVGSVGLAVGKKWQRIGEGMSGIVKGWLGLAVEKKYQRIGVERKRQRIGEARSGMVKGKAIRVWRSSVGKATRVRYGFIFLFFVFLFVLFGNCFFFFFLIMCWCGKLWKLQKFRFYIYIYIYRLLQIILFFLLQYDFCKF